METVAPYLFRFVAYTFFGLCLEMLFAVTGIERALGCPVHRRVPKKYLEGFVSLYMIPLHGLGILFGLEPVSAPVRRQYHKGWAMAPGSVYVAPGSILDNPFTHPDPQVAVAAYRDLASNGTQIFEIVPGELEIKNTRHPALNWGWPDVLRENMGTLRGRDFYVDCAPDVPSHVDFLIELANGPVLNVETEDAGGIR